MQQTIPSTSEDNHSYQRQLADSLIQCLGHDGAVYACQANTWHGVLAIVLDTQDIAGQATRN